MPDPYIDRCPCCGLSREQVKKHRTRVWDENDALAGQIDAMVAALRAVIENCKHTDVQAIRHQLVGILPEVQDFEPEAKAMLREKGMGHLVERQEAAIQDNWASYGYGEGADNAA